MAPTAQRRPWPRACSASERRPARIGDIELNLFVAGLALPSFFARLNPNGRMMAVGAVAGNPPADFGMGLFAAFQKSLSFATFSANTVTETDRRAVTAELLAAAGRGELRSVVHKVFPPGQAALAHQKMAAGKVFGRMVLTPPAS